MQVTRTFNFKKEDIYADVKKLEILIILFYTLIVFKYFLK